MELGRKRFEIPACSPFLVSAFSSQQIRRYLYFRFIFSSFNGERLLVFSS